MYLFFDTETTGLPRDYNAPASNLSNWPRLVQLAYLYYDKDGNLVSSGDHIILPDGFSIPADSSRIHGITTEIAMERGEKLTSVLTKFHQLVGSSNYLVAHNMRFDEKIVGAEFLRSKMDDPIATKRKICTMRETTAFCNIPGNFGPKWPKLSELHFKLFNEYFEEAHNAAVDITATAKCFWELQRLGVLKVQAV